MRIKKNLIESGILLTFINFYIGLTTYFYEVGFLSYFGISNEYININKDVIFKYISFVLTAAFYTFIGCYLMNVILKKAEKKLILACIIILCTVIYLFIGIYLLSYTVTLEKSINPSSLDLGIIFGFLCGIISVSKQIITAAKKKNNIQSITLDNLKYKDIKNACFTVFILVAVWFICSSYLIGKDNAKNDYYNIAKYENQNIAMVKSLNNNLAIFIKLDKDYTYVKNNYFLLSLDTNNIEFFDNARIKQK